MKAKYRELKGHNAKSSWKKPELISKILQPGADAPPRRSNEVKDPDNLLQELVNIVVRSIRLKPLEGEAKENCKKGHDMEPEIAKQLVAMGDAYPWGMIEEISRMGSVQKNGFEVATDSIDSHMGINDMGHQYLQLAEFKTRVSIDRARHEKYYTMHSYTHVILVISPSQIQKWSSPAPGCVSQRNCWRHTARRWSSSAACASSHSIEPQAPKFPRISPAAKISWRR